MERSFEEIAPLRFGYGYRRGEEPAIDREALLTQVPAGAANPAGFAGGTTPERLKALSMMGGGELRRVYGGDAHARVLWSVEQALGFYERLAFFWADHFTVSRVKRPLRVLVAPHEVEAIRPFIADSFSTLLQQAVLHPAMLMYLNQSRSVGPNSKRGRKGRRGLNENLAREILELHTLGVQSDYSQDDVRQFAMLLTGVTVQRKTGGSTFDPAMSEPGSVRILGKTYAAGAEGFEAITQALDDLAHHPATAKHLAWKLARHFLSDKPSEEVVQHLAAAYRDNNTQLMPVYRALLEHPAAYQTFGQKIRQPFDFLVTALRLALAPDDMAKAVQPTQLQEEEGSMDMEVNPFPSSLTLQPLTAMGQRPWDSLGPDGWAEEAVAWISPQGLTERLSFAIRMAKGPLRRLKVSAMMRQAFGPLAEDRLALLLREAQGAKEARVLILMSPEFQRR
ncbi:MAG: DUF1800 domain-containing protein [Rhodospirillales bacterium]|nr:DUF1800 domain-containing protein [Rhodospirillales bacterium]